MKAFTIKWDEEKDETTIDISADFLNSHWVTKADILKDTIPILEGLYNKYLTEGRTNG